MLTRTLTGVFALPIFLTIVHIGSSPLAVLLVVLSVIAVSEMQVLFNSQGHRSSRSVYFFTVAYLLILHFGYYALSFQVIVAYVLFILARQLFAFPSFGMDSVGASLLGALYPALLFGNVLMLRMEAGSAWTLAAIIGVWAYDTVAYIIGVRFGRIRPWVQLSPKKSVEGGLGGLLGSTLVFLFAHRILGVSAPVAIMLGVLIGLIGQVGDLAESALKRHAGVKDSGTLLPGHGGILDRFDSLLFAATAVYWFWKFAL